MGRPTSGASALSSRAEVIQSYTYCLPLSRFRSDAVISRASDKHPVVARPWPGGEKRRGGWASHHEECEALGSFLLPGAPPGVPDREKGLYRCTASGAGMDICSDALAWAQRAARV